MYQIKHSFIVGHWNWYMGIKKIPKIGDFKGVKSNTFILRQISNTHLVL
jgi:hypothetical protein